MARAAGTAD